jgi:hypothetical protein
MGVSPSEFKIVIANEFMSSEYFDNKIKAAINNSLQNGIPPIKKENMQRRYPEWYGFKDWLILD